MTKEEALAKIKELEKYIEELDNKVGFEDDEIFLLSSDEYKKYKDVIPFFPGYWWLRDAGLNDNSINRVNDSGDAEFMGSRVDCNVCCVRPAIHTKYSFGYIGDRIVIHSFPWIVIDTNLLIAEVPIAGHCFDKESTDYATSEIRQFLKDWLEERSYK